MTALRPPIDIRHDFLQYLQRPDIRRRNYEQKTFYFPDDIKKWMLAKTHEGGESNAINLLSAIYSDTALYSEDRFMPIRSDEIECCYLLFAILVQMECGHMVHVFRKHINSPTFLGTAYPSFIIDDVVRSLENERSNLPRKYAKGRYRAVAEEFDRLRWAFSPALNVLEMTDANIEQRSILPFFHSSIINTKGGTANVHHHKIQADLVQSLKLREALEPSKKADPEFGTYYEFAVKSYSEGWHDIYMMEIEAFRGFKGTENPKALGVVSYLGEYARRFREGPGPLPRETRHIMLEFGEHDLDEYLAETYQPVLNAEIIAFWKSIFRIAGAIKQIHQLEHAGINGSVKKYTGWHGDIKPDNILRVRGEFKLADFGFTKFEKNETGESTSAVLLGGTRTFGAPERDSPLRGDSEPRFLPTIDTWSFGCVLSAVATWVVLGSQAYDNYGLRRKMAHEEICERHKHDASISVSSCQDASHDGTKVLPAVLEWHEYLRNSTRRGDTVTCRVLDLVDKGMLIQGPSERLTSANLCKELDRIVEEAAVEYSQALKSGSLKQESEQTLKALLQLDQNAPASAGPKSRPSSEEVLPNNPGIVQGYKISLNPQRHSLSIPTNSRVRKSERLDKIMHGKHANREEAITQSVANTRPSSIFELNGEDSTHQPWAGSGPNVVGTHQTQDAQTLTGQTTHHQTVPLLQTSHVETPPRTTGINAGDHDPASPVSPSSGPRNTASLYTHLSPATPIRTRSTPLRHEGAAVIDEFYRLDKLWDDSKDTWSMLTGKIPQDSYLELFISNRDIKFVVDNAASMKAHWQNVTTTVLALAMKIGPLDEDGPDLVYTLGRKHNVNGAKGRSIPDRFHKSLKSTFNEIYPRNKTDMAATLSQLFDNYTDTRKKQTLIILTDGLWSGSGLLDDVEKTITNFITKLNSRLDKLEKRWFSIQFISFGDNEEALNRLRRLDDDLGPPANDDVVDDVVDEKPWNWPEVDELILGSIMQGADEPYDASGSAVDSPEPLTQSNSTPPSSPGRTPSSRRKRLYLRRMLGT